MASTKRCENCGEDASNACGKCKELGCNASGVGLYCSRDCQLAAFEAHKHIHKMLKRSQADYSSRGSPETIVLALKDASLRRCLPELAEGNSLNILMVGCRDHVEGSFSYSNMVNDLKNLQIYPTLDRINLTLCGPEVTTAKTRHFPDGNYSMTAFGGKLESVFPSLSSDRFSLAVIMQPGLSDYLRSWSPAFRILVSSQIPTITTGYSHLERWTMDAPVDESVIQAHFGGNILIPRTRNAAVCPMIQSRGMVPCAYYLMFKGIDETRADSLLSYDDTIKMNRIAFLQWVGRESIDYEGNPSFGNSCLRTANSLLSGEVSYPVSMSNKELENLIHSQSMREMFPG